MLALVLLRVWVRFSLALDVKESREAWSKRFGA